MHVDEGSTEALDDKYLKAGLERRPPVAETRDGALLQICRRLVGSAAPLPGQLWSNMFLNAGQGHINIFSEGSRGTGMFLNTTQGNINNFLRVLRALACFLAQPKGTSKTVLRVLWAL